MDHFLRAEFIVHGFAMIYYYCIILVLFVVIYYFVGNCIHENVCLLVI